MTQAPKPEVRNTKQRRIVTATLADLDDFMSAQELHQLMLSRNETVSLATIYRLLQSMAANNEVDVIRTEDGESVYRRCQAEHHHHHLMCRSCGKAVELEAPDVEQWAHSMAEKFGFTDINHTVEISGLCAECSHG
ncbi:MULTISPECIES: Fur family transcriptional regulator [unclassified Rothia (in: high G+C Gram-positive bacteria)]|uniref:Fur family transcriptional regulator n=1 Tax=unclassified Rothia (in: high G+C Gram-positive bacteria) TaxID=2689056 RepID=UPI0019576467|nr:MULTISPECIES: Fur family transcriptional regulator [unclassified Rothia (in: high G+C Gram-positive bacteria)]MBM7051045.1 transcriptional repressor [Rothia sp. ZJ1223]QRZ62250.1 transcriptional repressor [Rothia sp. ZJ932]